jgi:hypothetical protein
MFVAAFASFVGATPTIAAPCKYAKGKVTSRTVRMLKAWAAATKPGVTKDATGKCHIAAGPKKGDFTKC